MAKAGTLDWSELYKTGKSLEPEHPLSKPLMKGKTGAEQTKEFSKNIASDILNDFNAPDVRQPSNQEMFGGLVKSKEELEEIKKQEIKGFDEKLHAYHDWQHAKIVKKHNFDPNSWGNGRPILDDDQLEELKKANSAEVKSL